MQRPLSKYIATFLFLTAFLLPRVLDMHAFEHFSDDDEGVFCELCDIAPNAQQFDLFLSIVSYDDKQLLNIPSSLVIDTYYNSPLDKIVSPTSVYNKPPPHKVFG